MITRSSLLFAALALPLAAQDSQKPKDAAGELTFYKAYFLDKDQPKNKEATKKAIELYTTFLASNKDHKFAGRAAANCVVLLYASGDVKKAESFAKEFGSTMAAAEAKDAVSNDPMSMFGGMGRGGNQEANPNQDTIDKLMALHENANDTVKTRLSGAITRLGGGRELMMARFRGGFGGGGARGGGGNRGGGNRGGFGGGRGGRGGGGRTLTKPKIADMSKEDAKKAVEQFVTGAERIIDFMASNGRADAADALEAKLDKVQDLVDDGKLAEAQKVIDEMDVSGGRGGGDQGGRRRR